MTKNLHAVLSAVVLTVLAGGGAHAAEDTREPEGRKLFSARSDPLSSRRPSDVPDDATLEAAGAKIGTVTVRVLDVFDTSRPDENIWAFRTANRLHPNTRESTVRSSLLFEQGALYRGRLLQESERLLRDARYLYDASVTPIRYRDGIVDIEVVTRD
ncbi:MAG: hypothetical protein ACO3FH_11675, partial [Steroidobacteraceae bacterium]